MGCFRKFPPEDSFYRSKRLKAISLFGDLRFQFSSEVGQGHQWDSKLGDLSPKNLKCLGVDRSPPSPSVVNFSPSSLLATRGRKRTTERTDR
ncbi:hypothetical protein TNCT_295341 [Trichonephila clavata]|uniref:Uncharacterized protein n=1 Tax=Trichonephila clavata TaxID=2740835 RepID=A0A8X6F5C3_TRICU|nr:hypothetical protein TNCT_295341 [Trichonephila clavata]